MFRLILLLLLLSQISISEVSDDVISLNSGNFDSSIRDGNAWLIEFYAPWCSHCRRLEPTYQKVAASLHSQHKVGRVVKVAKVDGSAERALTSRFSVRGFPSFFLVEGWTVREYSGTRSHEAFVEFATESYTKVEPLPFFISPFGPMGQSKAFMLHAGTKVMDIHSKLVDWGLSPVVAGSFLVTIGVIFSMFLIIFIGLMTIPKEKND
mmetsp:Transcript_25114/g.36904  ORF Transcript_25114/g.36904 Transcript_25114/m.36904 type:complete len:208 (-) Transcript_25114:370-993(-)